MKTTGIVRRVDELGRIVLPIELRRTMDIAEKDMLEIFVEDSSIVPRQECMPAVPAGFAGPDRKADQAGADGRRLTVLAGFSGRHTVGF